MKVKIKRLNENAVIPKYALEGDAGMDLVATTKRFDMELGVYVYGTGLAFEIPKGYVGLVFPRSSLSNYDLMLTNHVGVIDSGYRGEVTAKFRPTKPNGVVIYEVGDRIAQMIIIPYPQVEFEEVDELSDSKRGTGGYGSTGSK
jgi:dUTP pyrophosphatase